MMDIGGSTDGRETMWKNKRYGTGIVLFFLCLFAAVSLTGCRTAEKQEEKAEGKVIEIPMILTVNPSSGIKNDLDVVEAFNREYAGVYKVNVEWVMETEEDYRQNLKRLNVTDELPAVITDLRMLPSFYQMMILNGRIEDLSVYISEDEEWRDNIEEVVLEGCSEPDGKIYLAPLSTAAFSCSGVFWNEELFSEAGIEEFPETWEEFWDCCECLKAQGITPLALHTEGTAWAPMLLATAELADTEEGAEFMKELYPESYVNESGVHLAETLKRLFLYTTEDAVYNDFDVAYGHFFAGEAAMIPNGYWMIDQIPEGLREKVRFSPFPGNKLISSPETFGWSVVSGYDKEVKEAAVEFLKFRTMLNKEEKEILFSMEEEALIRAENDYIRAYQGNPQIVPNYQVKWNSILQEETLGRYLPGLIKGEISAEEFTEREDESIRQFERER